MSQIKTALSSVSGKFLIFIVLLPFLLISCHKRVENTSEKGDANTDVPGLSGKPLRHVSMLPYWMPSAQFAGYYMGLEKGIFKKHGIDLELLVFDPLQPAENLIRENKTDFALLWMVNAMGIRNKGVDIVNIAQFSSRSSLMLITKKSSGIAKLEDMSGKRAGIWIGYELQPQALFRKFNLNVEMVPIGSTNNLFLKDGVQILNANWFDEYHSILNSGINEDELNKFFFADYGLNFLEDGLYCLAGKRSKDPELCRDFVEAVIESWDYVFKNQEEAIDVVIKYAREHKQPVNRVHQQWMLSRYQELYIPTGAKTINKDLKQSDYETIQQIMLEGRFIDRPIEYDSFYKPAK